MKREIKFREWNGIEMNYEPMISMISTASINDRFIDNDFMQFTGLCDVKGKEIYEGDILNFPIKNQFSNEHVAVKFSGGSFVVYNPNCCDICKNSFGCISDLGECLAISSCAEIIGNIYKNPELLNKKD